jgi:hypothetical protein
VQFPGIGAHLVSSFQIHRIEVRRTLIGDGMESFDLRRDFRFMYTYTE